MAGISKIEALNGITYDIKDAASRSAISTLEATVAALGTGAFVYRGSVASASNLPSGAATGDMYTVTDEGNVEYVWDGTNWIKLNNLAITNLQIDALF